MTKEKTKVENTDEVIEARDYLMLKNRSRENVEKQVRPAYFVPDGVKADVLFKNMRNGSHKFAIVLDEFGGFEGIITMNDLLEQLVGDLDDDMHAPEKVEDIVKIDSGTWRITGTASLSDVAAALEVELPLDEYDTFGGLIFGVYGSVPDDGVQFEIDVENLHVKVTEILEHRL